MVMPSFYREQKTAKVSLWKNISNDHGRGLNLIVQGQPPIFKEEVQYFNNMGFPVSTMNSTGVRVEYNSIDIDGIPKGFMIVFKYKVSSSALERFRSFIFNIPKDTDNIVLQELVKDFNLFYAKQRNRTLQYMESYNFDFVMYVDAEEMSGVDTVYIPECNMTLTSVPLFQMSSNPTLAMRYNLKPLRVYASDEYRDGFKYAKTIQVVAPDHVPDNYFYFLGKQVCMTEAVMMKGTEEGIRIITHQFDDQNKRFNVVTEFIPIAKAVENGFFRTKGDLLINGDPEEVARRKLVEDRIELERVRFSTEHKKAAAEDVKLDIRRVELKTEVVKASTENKRQVFENAKIDDRFEILHLESTLNREKIVGDIARERLGAFTEMVSAKMKIETAGFLNTLEHDRLVFKHQMEKETSLLSIETAREKADIESKAATRKNLDETLKLGSVVGGLINRIF
ncbi:MAG: hypothetical protein RR877_00860 [Aurantimicrobium sp.]|uniref:hypothetical protein n=1 Tax=Aurantimicrobium sp. TaxID=1930784 RepID=UPI002FCA2F53